ncbi:MAG: hypothetical protein NTV72_03165 [Candidatus Taylorbacteria bacterium]|nr:hypothetical protein [Candidatus Taylorbacteria bacterium]
MLKNKKTLPTIFGALIGGAVALFPLATKAVCPVCTLAVGAGLWFSRELGIDDTISGLWIGAIIISVSMWTINWLIKKNINFKWRSAVTYIGYIVIVIVPLYFMKDVWHPLNTILGINKLIVGMVLGGAGFYGTEKLYDRMKANNSGHAYFPFQKVVMPVVLLLILSAVFYFITK